jgi:HlyD family type I secretion membrane fusion protein
MDARQREFNIMNKRVEAMRSLAKAGHSSTNELRIVRSLAANKEAELADSRAKLGLRQQELQTARLQEAALLPKRQGELATLIASLDTRMIDVMTRMKTLQITIKNAVLRAPISGMIVDMQINTVGQVVGSGQKVLEIVAWSPVNSLKVKIKPTDIDRVWKGQMANIVLSAFPQRNMPQVRGKILALSADTIEDKGTGQKFYEARIQLDAASLRKAERKYGQKIELMPGMPAQAFIINGSNTLLGYLFEPYQLTFQKAFAGS